MFSFFNLKSKFQRFYKIFLLNKNIRLLEENIKRLSPLDKENSSSKNMDFSKKELEIKKEIEENIRRITERLKNNPEVILQFFKNKDTKVYRMFCAEQILRFINEEEGFIPPKNGLIAFYLNVFVNLFSLKPPVFSFSSKEIVVLSRKEPKFYKILYDLYCWYSFKMGLPGFEQKALEKFKKTHPIKTQNSLLSLSLNDIDEIRNVIRRKMQANVFVVEYSQELNSLQSLKNT